MNRFLKRTLPALAIPALVAGTGLAGGAVSASAIPLPSCSTTSPVTVPGFDNTQHCWYNTGVGNAGYLGADDNHTHYRYVTTDVNNNAQLVNLDGPGVQGAVGDELCDPNNHAGGAGGWVAEVGLFGNNGVADQADTVFYAAGFWAAGAPDPCVNHSPLVPDPSSSPAGNCPAGGAGSVTAIAPVSGSAAPTVFCGSFTPVAPGDQLDNLAVYYVHSGPFGIFHKISFGYCDVTQGICQQAYTHGFDNGAVDVNLWEFGIGVFNGNQVLGAPPAVPLETFASNIVTCYSCSQQTSITNVQPVNDFGVGGLEEGQTDNSSGQGTMSPDNSLTPSGFTVYNGSTSS